MLMGLSSHLLCNSNLPAGLTIAPWLGWVMPAVVSKTPHLSEVFRTADEILLPNKRDECGFFDYSTTHFKVALTKAGWASSFTNVDL
jgi:hypothetical protein